MKKELKKKTSGIETGATTCYYYWCTVVRSVLLDLARHL
jgi:hypothetical protein